jgi:hypothetical protein
VISSDLLTESELVTLTELVNYLLHRRQSQDEALSEPIRRSHATRARTLRGNVARAMGIPYGVWK